MLLLRFVKFQVKPSYCYGVCKSSAVVLDFWISQGSVATQLRWIVRASFLRNLTVKEFHISVYICLNFMVRSLVYFLIHTVHLLPSSHALRMQMLTLWITLQDMHVQCSLQFVDVFLYYSSH